MKEYKNRDDVPVNYKWDLSDIVADVSEFKEKIASINEEIKIIPSFVGCTKSPERLKEYLDFDEDLASRLMNLEIYAVCSNDTDIENKDCLELVTIIDKVNTDYRVSSAFFGPELLKLSKKDFNDLVNNPILKKYKSYLEKEYKYKDHILNEEEEKIVSKLTKNLGNYLKMNQTLLNSNHNYGKVKLEDGSEVDLLYTNYRKIMQSTADREKRKEIFKQFFSVIDQYASTHALILNDFVSTQDTISEIYKFDSPWDKKMFGLDLNTEIFDNLVSVLKDRKSAIKKYQDLKKKLIGVDELMPWDGPLTLYKCDKEYTIEEAQKLVLDALKILGDEYILKFNNIFDKHCIDYCQYKGKVGGGYNISGLDLEYSRILMSFNNDLESVSTIAHEGGHHVHHQYLHNNNDPLYRFQSTMVSEVASLTNECLLSYYLCKCGDKEEALNGLSNIIDVVINNLFGASCQGTFERKFYNHVHNGGSLNKDTLYSLYKENVEEIYPDGIKDDLECASWARISHYFYFYYVYSYSICISVALYVSSEIFNGNKDMLNKYYEFLTKGDDVKIVDVFKTLGIDLSDKLVYNKAIDQFENIIDEFESLYKEVNNGRK